MGLLNNNVESLHEYMVIHINDFLLSKKKKSERTSNTYKNQLLNLFKDKFGYDSFDLVTKKDIEKLTLPALRDYFDRMYESEIDDKREYSNSTINVRMSAIRQLIKYLNAWDVIKYPVFKLDELLKTLPNESNKIKTIPFDIAQLFFDYFMYKDNSETHLEKALFCKLAVDTGLRATEILSMTWDNFTVDGDWVIIESTPDNKGKGGVDWIDKISKELFEELLQLKKGGRNNLFTIQYRAMAHAMTLGNDYLGFKRNEYSVHGFKKTAVTMTYRKTNDFMSAVKKGRHKNPATTMRYIESIDYGLTGVISSGDNVEKDLYKLVSHEQLLEALDEIDNTTLYLINSKLNEKMACK